MQDIDRLAKSTQNRPFKGWLFEWSVESIRWRFPFSKEHREDHKRDAALAASLFPYLEK
jgi:hypothetical protein